GRRLRHGRSHAPVGVRLRHGERPEADGFRAARRSSASRHGRGGVVVTAPDAPPVEPLTLPLEEALARIGERGYTRLVYHHEDAPEYVLRDVCSSFARGSFGHWKDAAEAVLGVPVVPRDEAAELRAAVREYFALAAELDRRVKAKESYLSDLAAQLDAA